MIPYFEAGRSPVATRTDSAGRSARADDFAGVQLVFLLFLASDSLYLQAPRERTVRDISWIVSFLNKQDASNIFPGEIGRIARNSTPNGERLIVRGKENKCTHPYMQTWGRIHSPNSRCRSLTDSHKLVIILSIRSCKLVYK